MDPDGSSQCCSHSLSLARDCDAPCNKALWKTAGHVLWFSACLFPCILTSNHWNLKRHHQFVFIGNFTTCIMYLLSLRPHLLLYVIGEKKHTAHCCYDLLKKGYIKIASII